MVNFNSDIPFTSYVIEKFFPDLEEELEAGKPMPPLTELALLVTVPMTFILDVFVELAKPTKKDPHPHKQSPASLQHRCSITQLPIRQPALTPCGHVFEASALNQWIEKFHQCPFDLNPLEKRDLQVQRIAQIAPGALHPSTQVESDDALTFAWLKKHAEEGSIYGQFHLAGRYFSGRGVPQSDRLAVSWLKKAALQNNSDAMFMLGSCCQEGWGTEKNIDSACIWYTNAANLGHADAQKALESLERERLKSQQTTSEKIAKMRSELNRLLNASSGMACSSTDTKVPVVIQDKSKFKTLIVALKAIETVSKEELDEKKSLIKRCKKEIEEIEDQEFESIGNQILKFKQLTENPTENAEQIIQAQLKLVQLLGNSNENAATPNRAVAPISRPLERWITPLVPSKPTIEDRIIKCFQGIGHPSIWKDRKLDTCKNVLAVPFRFYFLTEELIKESKYPIIAEIYRDCLISALWMGFDTEKTLTKLLNKCVSNIKVVVLRRGIHKVLDLVQEGAKRIVNFARSLFLDHLWNWLEDKNVLEFFRELHHQFALRCSNTANFLETLNIDEKCKLIKHIFVASVASQLDKKFSLEIQ